LSTVASLIGSVGPSGAGVHDALGPIIGKQIPGAPSGWSLITRPPAYPEQFKALGLPSGLESTAYADGPASATDPAVDFFVFSSSDAAQFFYDHPGHDFAELESQMRPLAGASPVPDSRWIDLENCIYLSGPNPNAAPLGAPSSEMTPSGRCPIGSPRSVGLASITRLGSMVLVVHNPTGQLGEAPLPTSVASGYPPLVQLGVATLASNSIKLLRHPSIEATAVTTTTTAQKASATAQPISTVQKLAGPQEGQNLTLWLSETTLGGDEGLSFALHLVNHGTVPYDCDLLRVQVTKDDGSRETGHPLRSGRPVCLATPDVVPPGDQVGIPFYVSGYPYTVADKELRVMPYGATGRHVVWSLDGLRAGPAGVQP
jgi:hypothetical protein